MIRTDYPPCPKCGCVSRVEGYGLAAGPMGAYQFCDSEVCGVLLEFDPDVEGLDEETVTKLKENWAAQRKEVWGDKA